MDFLILIGLGYLIFIADIFFDNKLKNWIRKFFENHPVLAFAGLAIVVIVVYQSILLTNGSHDTSSYDERPTDCEYNGGWVCN